MCSLCANKQATLDISTPQSLSLNSESYSLTLSLTGSRLPGLVASLLSVFESVGEYVRGQGGSGEIPLPSTRESTTPAEESRYIGTNISSANLLFIVWNWPYPNHVMEDCMI